MAEVDEASRCKVKKQSGGSWKCLREEGHEGNHYFVGAKSRETEPAYEEYSELSARRRR